MPICEQRQEVWIGVGSEGVKVMAGSQRRESRGLGARRAGSCDPEEVGTGGRITKVGSPVTMVAKTKEQDECEDWVIEAAGAKFAGTAEGWAMAVSLS